MAKGRAADPRVAAIAAEAARHLEWLREAGVGELPPPERARPAPARAAPPPAAGPSRSPAGARAPEAPPAAPPSSKAPARTSPPASAAPAASPPAADPSEAYALTDKGCGSEELLAIRRELGACTRCKLHGGRTRLVFGTGAPRAELLFVGEGPGADEDHQGEPFVGKAGQLLTRMIEAMGFARGEVHIANVVKCRPPGNRDPEPDEIAACEPFLRRQIAAIRPKVIVALGRFAVQTLLRDGTPISKQRGRWREYEGVRCMPTFHPAYLLRNPPEKAKAWEDLKLVMKEFGKEPPRKG